MFTLGGATSGYCAIGSPRIAATPASMITIEITQAKTGRFAKNLASMSLPRGRRRGAARPRQVDLGGLHRHAGPGLHESLDDQLVAGLEAVRHQPAIADRAIRRHRSRL